MTQSVQGPGKTSHLHKRLEKTSPTVKQVNGGTFNGETR